MENSVIAEVGAMLFECFNLNATQGIRNPHASVGGRHVMVRYRERRSRPARATSGELESFKGLRRGHFVDQVAVDIQQGRAVRLLGHHVGIPYFCQKVCGLPSNGPRLVSGQYGALRASRATLRSRPPHYSPEDSRLRPPAVQGVTGIRESGRSSSAPSCLTIDLVIHLRYNSRFHSNPSAKSGEFTPCGAKLRIRDQ